LSKGVRKLGAGFDRLSENGVGVVGDLRIKKLNPYFRSP
jgi:hypothetical protein